jgi:hypothetical protein
MPEGVCRMCLELKELVNSHFMPSALYDYCRDGEHRPIRVGGGLLIPTDRQTQWPLLCKDCEAVLSRGGEDWVLDKLATWERNFPLYDILNKGIPVFIEDGLAIYETMGNPEMKPMKLVHFALGIFWKASVHSWRKGEIEPWIELGEYSNKIRLWLLGKGEFPAFLYLVVSLSRPERAQIAMNEPYEGIRTDWRAHFLPVPGVLFMLNIGKTVDESMRAISINSQGNPINVSDDLANKLQRNLVDSFRRSRKTNAFRKAMAKIGAERKS